MAKLPQHLFIACDGTLHDTRVADWSSMPLRENYSRSHRHIESLADVKACLRHGEFAWPGGYQMYFITNDGAALSFETVRSEFASVAWDWLNDADTGWRVVALDINYEDPDLYDAHTSEPIPAAYC